MQKRNQIRSIMLEKDVHTLMGTLWKELPSTDLRANLSSGKTSPEQASEATIRLRCAVIEGWNLTQDGWIDGIGIQCARADNQITEVQILKGEIWKPGDCRQGWPMRD